MGQSQAQAEIIQKTMEMTPEAFARLERMREESGAPTLSQVLRDALMDREKIQQGHKQGKVLQWRNADGTVEDF